ncbi:monovalent cation:proton antiporter-2 (CPA2) family protein [Pelagicoccus mobilis]|uniref:Cation:proton antiporter n=1 Tax=Pelagicoccus mobilis TaxID=415221 RepID=A0A934S2R1_9BACT|nr:monovalent cation:proton antiporter-2 (CPA2) family protein [Pelagicoccus mobilis]MBK1880110.1 cation:proton antiporter [Pelagicoccus mobilis]
MEQFLLQLFIFLAAAAIAVPIAKKLGLGSVLGYLIAGIVIGPFGFSMIGNVEDVMHFTEFGVVMMLFLVGLELKPSLLWQMRTPILGMGGTQVVVSSVLIAGVAIAFLPWQQGLAVGLILSLSSTAIVLQTLREKGLMDTSSGRSIFSVLLFQDLAVIPMLALLPLLATVPLSHDDGHHGSHLFDIGTLPGYAQVLITLGAILAILLLGKYASRPIFRIIASTRVREIFVAAALALVVGISVLMTVVGLSPALGAFLAGVVLADSEYRHELESDIEPFKGLLLGIFFISIGASLNFTLIGDEILLITGLVLGLMGLKALVLFVTGLAFKVQKSDRTLFSISLAQGGEFAFVLFQFSKTNGVLPSTTIDPLISAVAISMFLTPLLFLAYDKLSAKQQISGDTRESDNIDKKGHKVILAGFGRLGTDLGRFLMTAGIKPVILDHDAGNVDVLRKFGFEVYYGDVTRLDLLEAAGAAEAELLVITISDVEKARELVELVSKHYPHLKIASIAADRTSAYELMDHGVTVIRRETYGSALNLGFDTLKLLGFEPYEASRMKSIFQRNDDAMLSELHKIHRQDEENYVSMYQKHTAELEELMTLDKNNSSDELDKAWAPANPED